MARTADQRNQLARRSVGECATDPNDAPLAYQNLYAAQAMQQVLRGRGDQVAKVIGIQHVRQPTAVGLLNRLRNGERDGIMDARAKMSRFTAWPGSRHRVTEMPGHLR